MSTRISKYDPDFHSVFKKLLRVAKLLSENTEQLENSEQGFYIDKRNEQHVLVSICSPISEEGDYSLDVGLSFKRPITEKLETVLCITFTASKNCNCITYELLAPTCNFEYQNFHEMILINAATQVFASHVITYMTE